MSTKGNMTRSDAVAIFGEAVVGQLDGMHCEPTSRLQCDGDTRVEFAASIRAHGQDGVPCTLTAYYYQDQQALQDAGDDLSGLNWVVEGYEVC